MLCICKRLRTTNKGIFVEHHRLDYQVLLRNHKDLMLWSSGLSVIGVKPKVSFSSRTGHRAARMSNILVGTSLCGTVWPEPIWKKKVFFLGWWLAQSALLIGIGSTNMPKYGGDQSPSPRTFRRPWITRLELVDFDLKISMSLPHTIGWKRF